MQARGWLPDPGEGGFRETWTAGGNSNSPNQMTTGYEALLAVVRTWSSGGRTRRAARGSTWWWEVQLMGGRYTGNSTKGNCAAAMRLDISWFSCFCSSCCCAERESPGCSHTASLAGPPNRTTISRGWPAGMDRALGRRLTKTSCSLCGRGRCQAGVRMASS